MDNMQDSSELMVIKDRESKYEVITNACDTVCGDLQQFHKLGKLADDTRQMRIKFSNLIDNLIKSLECNGHSPKNIIDVLGAYIPDDCQKASDLDEFFVELLPHMSFFNYEIPKLIIQHLEMDLVGQLVTYEAQFSSYCKNRLSGPHPVVIQNEAQSKDQLMQKMLVKLDVEWDGFPIEYIERFRCKLGSVLNIKQEKLLLQSIQKGCVLLTFVVHRSLLQMIINNGLTHDQRHALCESEVISIEIGSVAIFENLELFLFRSCRKGELEHVAVLIERQVDVNVQQDGWSPLMYASFYGHFKIATILLENGALVDVKNNDGITPLMAVSQNGHIDVAKILQIHHADINARDLGGWTALMYATQFNYSNIAQFLVEHQADLDAQNEEKVSALHLACHHGHSKIVKIFLEAGVKVDIRDQAGDTPLIYACQNGHSDVVDLLINDRANPNATSRKGLTPLMCAVESHSAKTVETLLHSGAQTSLKEPVSQWTALFFAAKCGNLEIVELLLDSGADAHIKDKDGITPLEVAQVHGHVMVCTKLEKESQTDLKETNLKRVQEQVLATTMYIHNLLRITHQKSGLKQFASTKSTKQTL